jgi:phosphoserine aminotransferase
MNFNPGPATLPLAALERAQRELLDLEGTGMSVIEHSHRGKAYEAVHNEAIALTRELLAVPDNYHVLLLQGGASLQFAMVPMNLLEPEKSADYIVTGYWSEKAVKEAKSVGRVRIGATTKENGQFRRIPKPKELDLDPSAAYVHITSNNTIAGTQWHQFPDSGNVPLVADMSSDIMWRPLDVSKFALIYAGAQKNLGPSGLTLVLARKDLVESARKDIPAILQYGAHAEANSLYNTPPTFSVYLYRNVLAEVKKSGGLSAMERHNREKANLIYAAIDARKDLYLSPIEPESRSTMNIVFNLPTPELEAEFLAQALARGMVGLKGHRSVGGVRASVYNAASMEWARALAELMHNFRRGS